VGFSNPLLLPGLENADPDPASRTEIPATSVVLPTMGDERVDRDESLISIKFSTSDKDSLPALSRFFTFGQ
jgi:hypothetical protein